MTKDQKEYPSTIPNLYFNHFDYEEFPVCGVGKSRQIMVNFDPYIDTSMNQELHLEACIGLARIKEMRTAMVYGSIPPEEEQRLGGNKCWSEILMNLDQHDPTGQHRKAIEYIISQEKENTLKAVYKYVYYAMGGMIPWFFTVYLKNNDFRTKTQSKDDNWTPEADYFPKIVEYIKTLPFKSIGRVLFFTTFPGSAVPIHRDSIVAEHSDHNINLFFCKGRPSFVWDSINKKKIYLDQSATSYFFNNRDYHGVDAESEFRYTVRVDGTFTDEICDKLDLEDGKTWKWDYAK